MTGSAASLSRSEVTPLGVPPAFLADILGRYSNHGKALRDVRAATHEFMDARGHAFSWGQLHVQRTGGLAAWTIVPVEMWESLFEVRLGSTLTIPEIHRMLHGLVRDVLRGRIPRSLLLTGCQGGERAMPHSLFSLLCTDPQACTSGRAWISDQLIPVLLPELFKACNDRVRALMVEAHRRRAAASSATRPPRLSKVGLTS